MKFSIKIAALAALALFSSSVKADDSMTEAIKAFCGGLNVTTPTADTVLTPGQSATITVTRVPNEHEKTITGVDLFVAGDNPRYIQNVWAGKYQLNTQATLTDAIPANITAGIYYFRVWVTNIMNGGHGPDCLQFSPNFKVTTGTHTNEAGFVSYNEHLDDPNIYNPDHLKGCFGLTVQSPKEGDFAKQGSHVTITLNRDSASQTEYLTDVDIYKKSENGQDERVDSVWFGNEMLSNVINLKDQIKIPEDKYDPNAQYYYKIQVTSSAQSDEKCTFQSGYFKVVV